MRDIDAYNRLRPHSSLGYLSPAMFAASLKHPEPSQKVDQETGSGHHCLGFQPSPHDHPWPPAVAVLDDEAVHRRRDPTHQRAHADELSTIPEW